MLRKLKVPNKSSEIFSVILPIFKVSMNLAHIKCLSMLLGALCAVQTVCLSKLAGAFDSKASRESSFRRIQRFMSQMVHINRIEQLFGVVIIAYTWAWYYGEVLRDRRKELGLTQKELAEKIGRERTYINRIEKGETDLQLSSFLRIADALGITLKLEMSHPVLQVR